MIEQSPDSAAPLTLQSRKSRRVEIVAFVALGFTTSLMNALNETPGSTQAFLPLIFAFVGGFALTFGGLAKSMSNQAAMDVASMAILMLCVGALLGLPTGLALRFWGERYLPAFRASVPAEPPRSAAPANVDKPAAAQARLSAVSLHSSHPCPTAARALGDQREWLESTENGRLVAEQFELLLERSGCAPLVER